MPCPGDYMVGPVIGEGAFGTVRYGIHKASQQEVAIKVIDKVTLRKRPAMMQAVQREQRILRTLSNHDDDDDDQVSCTCDSRTCSRFCCCRRRIIQLYASFHDEECVYLVMECCNGGDLSVIVKQQRRKLQQQQKDQQKELSACDHDDDHHWAQTVSYYGLQILSGLEYLHSRGIIHADLKPENVLLTKQDHSRGCGPAGGCNSQDLLRYQVKLSDFGSAIIMEQQTEDTTVTTTQTATAGSNFYILQGSPEYASPELLRGRPGSLCSSSSSSYSTSCAALQPKTLGEQQTSSSWITTATDLWSFGCLLFACWTGHSPFEAASESLAVQKVLSYNGDIDTINIVRIKDDDINHDGPQIDTMIPDTGIYRYYNRNDTSRCLTQSWTELVHQLLHVDPHQRLGRGDIVWSDKAGQNGALSQEYKSIRLSRAWSILNNDFAPVPTEPEWVQQQKLCPALQDGKEGWRVYML